MNIQTVPYTKLNASNGINAREANGYTDGIDELAAQIKAVGLINPLTVRPGQRGAFDIIAGKRRYLAIGKLINAGVWPQDRGVPVTVRDDSDGDALEASLIENIARKAMHPVQEYEIFARLHHGDGADVDAIAERYGVATKIVRQRLALGRLAPEILKAWRDGEIGPAVAEAYAACRDKKQQAATFKRLRKERSANLVHMVRVAFVKDRPRIDDKRLAFVGRERYLAAGGKIVENLFEGDGYLEDGALLKRLVDERLGEVCEDLEKDGWSFAILAADIPHHSYYSWARVQPKKAMTEDEKKRHDEITAKVRKLQDADSEDDYDAINALEDEQQAIDDAARVRGFTKAQKAKSGCVVEINGEDVSIQYGLIRGKTQAQLDREKEKAKKTAEGDDAPDEDQGPVISSALLVDITAAQTTAVTQAIAKDPDLAIRVLAAALMPKSGYGTSPVRITVDGMTRYSAQSDDDGEPDYEGSGFAQRFAELDRRAPQALAVHLGRALDLRQQKHSAPTAEDVAAIVNAIPAETYLHLMRENFSAADYFARASSKVAQAALAEMGVPAPERAAGKTGLAEAAATEAKAKGWLPAEIRHPGYALIGAAPVKKKKAA